MTLEARARSGSVRSWMAVLALGGALSACEDPGPPPVFPITFLAQADDARGEAIAVDGLADVCHALLTLNEFAYVD